MTGTTESGNVIPPGLKYTRDHLWLSRKENSWVLGITEFAQREMGRVTMVDLPEEGDLVKSGRPLGSLESGKWVQKLRSPLDGEVIAMNREAALFPACINQDPFGKGWLLEVEASQEPADLLDHLAYATHVEQERIEIREGKKGRGGR